MKNTVIPSNIYLDALIKDYDSFVQKEVEEGKTPGAAVAIVYDTSVVFLKGYGKRAFGSGDRVDIHSVFRLGSVSKGFAAILTGILVQDGAVGWDDKIVRYLPEFSLKNPKATEELSVKNVLSHTTGLPYHSYTNLIEAGWTLPDMIRALGEVDLIGPVGKLYSYQNVAYSIIAEVVRSATGKSYQDLVKERIFTPLHMDDASMNYQEITVSPDLALPHYRYHGTWRPKRIHDTYYNAAPAGGVNASISDMSVYLLALLGHHPEVITEHTLGTIFTPEVRTSKYKYSRHWKNLKKTYYGLGWRVFITSEDTIIYHGGYVDGYRSEIALSPSKKTGICVLTNASNRFSSGAVPEYFRKLNYWYDSIDSWQSRYANLPYTALP